LAREAAADNVDFDVEHVEHSPVKQANVVEAHNAGPVLGEDGARVRFDFAERDRFKAARSFESKGEAAYAGEEIEGSEHFMQLREYSCGSTP
jgi:hypothetical protein